MRPKFLLAAVLLASAARAQAAEIPATKMRGIGAISARLENVSAKSSLLRLSCENISKAQLTHAKYLSDLQSLRSVREQNEIELVTRDNPDRGQVRALRLDFYDPKSGR